MSDPTRGGAAGRAAKKDDRRARMMAQQRAEEDSLRMEAYGASGGALRGALKKVGEAASDSTKLQKFVARVKKKIGG